MQQSSIPSAQILVQYCKAYGVRNIVISPGSRSAPLTLSFTEDSFFKCYSIVDERSAAFFALGIAQQLREPVATVCTSGSALLNYYPAVAEAFYSDIPLVVISADRPGYKIDVGDGQTIRQDNVFDRHIGYSANLKQDASHATNRLERYMPGLLENENIAIVQDGIDNFNRDEVTNALNTAVENNSPVHINIPFEEPLYEMIEKIDLDIKIKNRTAIENEPIDVDSSVAIWNQAKRKMVLVGTNPPDRVKQEYLDLLVADPSVIVLTETTSNLHHPDFFPSIDSIIAPIELSTNREGLFSALRPEILLTFGGLIVSKKIKAFLREYQPDHHWHVDPKKANDTFFNLTHHFKTDPNVFFESFLPKLEKVFNDYFGFWNSRKKKYESMREEYLRQIPFSDLLAFERVLGSIPEKYQLQLANSSTVRYTQLFELNPSLHVYCNRGTSGIDGSVSTAVGASIHPESPTLLITGDLSFLYDNNGLWNEHIRPDFRIIIINNSGGGIFRILPGHQETEGFKLFLKLHMSCRFHTFAKCTVLISSRPIIVMTSKKR